MTNTQTLPTIDETGRVLAAMMTENTGRHLLDSGGAYGRNWERNAGMTPEAFALRPEATIDTWTLTAGDTLGDGLGVTIDTYAFLRENLTFDEHADDILSMWCATSDRPYLVDVEAFLDALRDAGAQLSGLYGDGEPMAVNTYNHESALSQVIQYTYVTAAWLDVLTPVTCDDCGAMQFVEHYGAEDGATFHGWHAGSLADDECTHETVSVHEPMSDDVYIILQIHGGCDVRGGYTRPRMFTDSGMCELGILDDARVSVIVDAEPLTADPGPCLPNMPEPNRGPFTVRLWSCDAGYRFDDGDVIDETGRGYWGAGVDELPASVQRIADGLAGLVFVDDEDDAHETLSADDIADEHGDAVGIVWPAGDGLAGVTADGLALSVGAGMF